MNLYNLRTEYRKDPIGLTVKKPRFSWKIESKEKETMQESYHIIVKEAKVQSTDPNSSVWDSGVVKSSKSVLISYDGMELKPETSYNVAIEITDNHGNTANEQMTFETGIFDNQQFKAKMITHDFPEKETSCPVFEKEFGEKPDIVSARIYATAHGVYEIKLNGVRVGDYRMAPGWTSYHTEYKKHSPLRIQRL